MLFLPVHGFAPWWSPYGGCHARSDAALVAQWRRVRGIVEETGQLRGFRVVGRSGGRAGHPYGSSGRGAGVLEARPGPVVPARVRARLVLPVPARHGSAVHDQGPGLVRVVCGRHEACEDLDRTGRPPADGPAGRGLTRPRTTRPARLGRGRAAGGPARPRSLPPGSVPVAARWSAGYGVIVDEGLVGDCDRLGRRACCTVHARTRPENMGCWMTRLSQRQVLAFHQDTPVPAEQPKESTPQIRVLNNPPPLGDRLPHTKRNRHRTQTPQSDSLNQTFTTVRETHFTPVSPAKECRWLGQLWSA